MRRRDFKRVAQGGFGDGLNAYAHSMAWFDGHLYVGTTRGNFPFMKARLPIGMDVWPVECPEVPFDLDMRAEIWRYAPRDDRWERVFKAPTIIGSHGKPIPRELGLRGMVVYDGRADQPPALFVTTWSPARGPGPLVLRSEDGRHFEPTCEPGLTGLPVTTIRTITQFKGRMFTTPAGSRGGNPNISAHSVVYETSDPAHGGWEPVCDFGFGDPNNKTIFEMVGFGDHLYVGTFNLEGYQIWRSTCEGERPYVFEKVIDKGAYRGPLNQCALSMATFKGALYVGSGIQGGGVDTQNKIGPAPPELIRIHPDGSWDLLVGDSRDTPDGRKECLSGYLPGFDNFFNGYFWRLCEHDGWLYASTFEWSSILGYANRQRLAARRSRTSSTTSTRRRSSTTNPASTSIAASTARTGCRSRPTAWTTRTTWACARWCPRRMACSSAPPIPSVRRSCRSAAIATCRIRAAAARSTSRPAGAASDAAAAAPWWRRCRAAGSGAAVALPAGARVERDLAYGPEPAQCLDVYLPAGAADRGDPGHRPRRRLGHRRQGQPRRRRRQGGALAAGRDRRRVRQLSAAAARRRAAAGRRRGAGDRLRAEARAAWQADPARLVVVGHSTGAHLAALLAADPALAEAQGAAPWLAAVLLDSAALDVVEIMRAPHRPLYDRAFGADEAGLAGAVAAASAAGAAGAALARSLEPAAGCGRRVATVRRRRGGARRVAQRCMRWRCRTPRSMPGSGLDNAYTERVDAFLKSVGVP